MIPTRAFAVVLDDRPLLTMITETRPDPSQFHPCCQIVQVEIREMPKPECCVWTREDFDDDVWSASCGPDRLFVFTTGGPVENRMAYCPYCGKPLVEAEPVVEPDKDDDDG